MKRQLKLGVIGAGFVANFHLMANTMVPDLEIGGVFALKGAEDFAVKSTAQGRMQCQVCRTIRQLVEENDVIAMFAPNYTRVQLMEELVEAVQNNGKQLNGLICEKPLGRTIAEARRMVELAKSTESPTAYFENQIHMKAVQKALIQLLRLQKTAGPFTLVKSNEEHPGPHEPWFWNPTLQGGGVLSDMACHSIAQAEYILTPWGFLPGFLKPVAVQAETTLLKWGQPKYRAELLERTGVDYTKTPAEDFATGIITYRNPSTGGLVKTQFTNSWMFDKQGLRLSTEAMGPGYGFEINSLRSSLEIFISDAAAQTIGDAEAALEKSTASRGLLTVQPNEVDLYGYVDEQRDALKAFCENHDALLSWEFGLHITRLCQAAYMAAEERRTLDLTDPDTTRRLETYRSAISRGEGHKVLGLVV